MKKNYFWGVFLILAGAYLVVSQMGYLPGVGPFTLIFTIVCLAVLVSSVLHLSFGGILFPLAFIGIMYDHPLGITAITPWTILLAALLGTIGLNLLFGRFKKKHWHKHCKHHKGYWNVEMNSDGRSGDGSNENLDGEWVYIRSSFSSVIRYVTSENLQSATIEASFGAAQIYFDNAQIPSGQATVNIDSKFAGVELYVPHNWQVINHVASSFGAVDEENRRTGEWTATLMLEGSNSFGGITIIYV